MAIVNLLFILDNIDALPIVLKFYMRLMHLKRISLYLLIIHFTIILPGGNILPAEIKGKVDDKIIYTIKKGDTLWSISEKYLKNPFLWQRLWSANRYIFDPSLIEPGFDIVIPPLVTKMLDERPLLPAEGTASAPAITPLVEAAPAPPAGMESQILSPEAEAPLKPPDTAMPLPPAESTGPLLPSESTAYVPGADISGPFPVSEGTYLIEAPSAKKALIVGMDKCRECHEGPYVQWNKTIHAKWKPQLIKPEKVKEIKKTDCETCHGPGSLHVRDPGNLMNIISFGAKSADTRDEQNAVCLKCHEKGGLFHWKADRHGMNLRCTDCHHVMDNLSGQGLLNDTSEKDICLRCHVQKKKDLLRSPHLAHNEEKMSCSTCHDPHGSDTPGMLSAISVNDNCYKCHADKRGPYLFDHLPVQENCLLCHEPHSSMNRSLLKMRQPFLCLECHSNLPVKGASVPDAHDVLNPNSRFTYNKGCTNCHPMIHGSRHPSGARLQR